MSEVQEELDWLIVGGGIHGAHVAVRLVTDGGVPLQRIRIVDPGPALLSRWRTCAARTGMSHMRSPSMHHIDRDPYSLHAFAETMEPDRQPHFVEPNDRPSLDLFNAHCAAVIDGLGLESIHVQAHVDAVAPEAPGVKVRLDGGETFIAKNAVLSLGSEAQLQWPRWAPRDDLRIQHVFSADYRTAAVHSDRIAVIGGGITAAQVAIEHAGRGHQVDLISRHPAKTEQYDSDPGWFGPKYMRAFDRMRSLADRRRAINGGRNRGSIPPDTQELLQRAMDAGDLHEHIGGIEGLDAGESGLRLRLEDGRSVDADKVVIATGYAPWRPGGTLVDDLASGASLPLAPCGFPVVDHALRWHPRIHVTGALAELELGPIARNIAGARRAAERILSAVALPSNAPI